MHDRPQNAECQLAFHRSERVASIPLFLFSGVDTRMPEKKNIYYFMYHYNHLKSNLRIYCYKDQLSVQGEIMFCISY